jgi:hypothetical protein
MAYAIRYTSADDLASYAPSGTVSNTETTALTVKDIDIDSDSVASIGGNTQGTLFINFTKGSLTNCTIRIYQSYLGNPDTGDWYQETSEADSSGALTLNPLTIVLTATAKLTWHFPIGAARATKVTVQSLGTVTASNIKLYLSLRSN